MYREAIELSPHTASHHLQLACFLWRTDRLLDAWASFEKCRELDRGNVNALRLYGTFLQDLLVTYKNGVNNNNNNNSENEKFNKKFPKGKNPFGNNNNNQHQQNPDYERIASVAEGLFKRAFELDPRDVSVLKSYASFLAEIRKDIRTAQELLTVAMKLELETRMAREEVLARERNGIIDDDEDFEDDGVDDEEDDNNNSSGNDNNNK